MRLWIIWVVLAFLWALQAGAALVVHKGRAALIMFIMAAFFALIGWIVRQRTRTAAKLKLR